MIKIYFKILALSLPAIIAVVISCHYFSGNFIDYYYPKITNDGQSLIIGTSRASQGIIPDSVMKGTRYDGPMLNFAFSSFDSPFDAGYYNAIEKKLNSETKNGLFIIEIDPFALSVENNIPAVSPKLNDQLIFKGNPNYEYVYRNVNPFYKLIENRNFRDDKSIQHPNGWLEIVLPMDSASVKSRAQAKLSGIKNSILHLEISNERMEYLKKTIGLLKDHGTVILIKIPAWQEIMDMENNYSKKIDSIVNQMAMNMKIKYYDLSSESSKYTYVDGNHLDKRSAMRFSSELNKIILKNE